MKGVNNAKKNIAQLVYQKKLFSLGEPLTKDNDLNARNAIRHLYGKENITSYTKKNTGLNYGLKKATQLGNYVYFRATANQSLNRSKIIGLKDCLMSA